MIIREHRRRNLTVSILSLSLLTVMTGAAVAPALNTIRAYFSDVNQTVTQMIISMPALFIVIMSPIFPKLCTRFKSKALLMTGLLLYVVGGSMAGIFNNIYVVLFFRSLIGIGVGIIMPLSTGLISFYFTRDKQDKLMGYSSAMNQMGGVIATLAAGLLSSISWRLSFLVYLMGLLSIVLCLLYVPNEKFALGYLCLWLVGGWAGTLVGSALIGFANGLGVPFIISTASRQAGKSAAVTVMPMLSMALYLAQFTTPIILSFITGLAKNISTAHLPYMIAFFSALLFALWSVSIKSAAPAVHNVKQE